MQQVWLQAVPEQRASRAGAEALGEPVRHEFRVAPELRDSRRDGWELGLLDELLNQAGLVLAG